MPTADTCVDKYVTVIIDLTPVRDGAGPARLLRSGADLFTDKQSDRLRALFVDDATEALNGRLEHLRGSALGFRNLTNDIARSLLETGGFRPQLLHPRLG